MGQSLRPVAVDAKGAKQQVQPPCHRPQSIAVECAQVLVGDDPLEERAGEGLQAEGQAGCLEAVLPIGAVHARDAGRDVALQVDVLERLDRSGAQDDLLEPLEDREEQLQGHLGLVPPEGLLQRRDQVGVDPSERTQPIEGVGVVERVLAPDLPPHAEEEGDLLAPHRIGVGELGEAGVDIRGLRREDAINPAPALGQAGRHRPRARMRPLLGEQFLHDHVGDEASQGGGVAGRPEAEDLLREGGQQRVAVHVALLAQEVAERVVALLDLVEPGRGAAQLALGTDLVEVDREDLEELLDQEIDGAHLAPQQR